MGKRNKTEIEQAEPAHQRVDDGNVSEPKPTMYVVVREGFRVSDKEYLTADDPAAIAEKEFWSRIANKHSYGEPVEIVQYESKKHRIW